MLVNMKEKRNIYPLLVSLKSCTAPLEITIEISQKLKLDILYNWAQSLLAFRHYTDLPTVNWQDVLANIQAVFWTAQGPDNVISYVVNANDLLKGGDHLLPPSLPLSWSLSLCLPVSLSLSLCIFISFCALTWPFCAPILSSLSPFSYVLGLLGNHHPLPRSLSCHIITIALWNMLERLAITQSLYLFSHVPYHFFTIANKWKQPSYH